MGVVWDLAEALNIGWGEFTGQGGVSLRDRLKERSFRRAVATELRSDDDTASESAVRKVMKSAAFLEWLEQGGETSLDQHLSDEQASELGIVDRNTAQQVGGAIGQAMAAAAFSKAKWVERVLLGRSAQSEKADLAQLDYLEDIWDVLHRVAERVEGLAESKAGEVLQPFVSADRHRAWIARRRGGLVEAVPYVPPDPSHLAHPDELWRHVSSRGGCALLVHGPGGTGKTRACLEVTDRASRAGWRVVHALPGEPIADNDGLAEIIFARDSPVLVVLDYLNELHGLDLASIESRILPAAANANIQVALLASARSGWLSTGPPLGPFERGMT